MRLYDTKLDDVEEEEEQTALPFRMTKAELASLDPNYKAKKKKVTISGHLS